MQDKITYNISLLSLVSNHHIDKVCSAQISMQNVLIDSRRSRKMDYMCVSLNVLKYSQDWTENTHRIFMSIYRGTTEFFLPYEPIKYRTSGDKKHEKQKYINGFSFWLSFIWTQTHIGFFLSNCKHGTV